MLILHSPSNSDNHPLRAYQMLQHMFQGGDSLGTHDNDLMRQILLALKHEDSYNMDLYLNAKKKK